MSELKLNRHTPYMDQNKMTDMPELKNIVKKDTRLKQNGIPLTIESNAQYIPGRSETTIAATNDGNIIFVAFNSQAGICLTFEELGIEFERCPPLPEGQFQGVTHYTVSIDGGKTFIYSNAPPPLTNKIVTFGDPWLSMGGRYSGKQNEIVYLSSLAFDSNNTQVSLGIVVHIAEIEYDINGKAISFNWIRESLIPNIETTDFLDKEAIAADPYDPLKCYMVLSKFIVDPETGEESSAIIQFYKTINGGIDWIGPVNVSIPDEPVQGSYIAVGLNGNLYAIWYQPNIDVVTFAVKFSQSFDEGLTWTIPKTINPISKSNNPFFSPPPAYSRRTLLPVSTMDVILEGKYKGRIIVSYRYSLQQVNFNDFQDSGTNYSPDSTVFNSQEIGLLISDDNGETFEDINPINIPITNNLYTKRIWPSVTTNRCGNEVNIVYLEINEIESSLPCRQNPDSFFQTITDTYYVTSIDGGITFNDPVKLNKFSDDWCNSFTSPGVLNFGDYLLSLTKPDGGVQIAAVSSNFSSVVLANNETFNAIDTIFYDTSPILCRSSFAYNKCLQQNQCDIPPTDKPTTTVNPTKKPTNKIITKRPTKERKTHKTRKPTAVEGTSLLSRLIDQYFDNFNTIADDKW